MRGYYYAMLQWSNIAHVLVCLLFSYYKNVDGRPHFDGKPIKVFTLDPSGNFIPVDLPSWKSHLIKYPSSSGHPSFNEGNASSYEETERGPQKIHSCKNNPPIAKNREHHLHVHQPDDHLPRRRYRRSVLRKPTRQTSSQAHTIETLVVGDFGLYTRFFIMNGNNQQMALLAMTDYYANVIKAVNRRYESMFQPPFSVTVVPTAFVFITIPQGSPWTENRKIGQTTSVQGEQALNDFTTFAGIAKTQLLFDHAALISGYDLKSDDGRSDLLGIAFRFGVCSPECTSLNEESFSEQTPNTLAHEIGHSLGAEHDGSGNPCSASDFFVMAPSSALPTTILKGSNPWTFSSCTTNVVRSFLGTSDAECTISNLAPKSIDITPFVGEEYGQRVDADMQCRLRYGPISRFCRESYFVPGSMTFNDMCYNLRCFNPVTESCVLIPAHDGTSCGNRKWCFKGLCIANQEAPERLDTCPQLDDPTRSCTIASCAESLNVITYCCNTCKQFSPSVSPPPPSLFPSPSPVS